MLKVCDECKDGLDTDKDGSPKLSQCTSLKLRRFSLMLRPAVTKTRTGLGLDWRWTGAFLNLNTSEHLFSYIFRGIAPCTFATQIELDII